MDVRADVVLALGASLFVAVLDTAAETRGEDPPQAQSAVAEVTRHAAIATPPVSLRIIW
ncbi:MAG TPA: hypothetical protein VFP55_02330 [Solirubrobacteraceae bacterium]|nr:hypothetical protein [Solirubrobacteraceae bacterium]